jgi:enoyl-[acyl-carrier protein] reductase II
VGSLFAASIESSAHENFKSRLTTLEEGDTALTLKQLTPVRLIKNKFYESVRAAEERGATKEELAALLGMRRAKQGIFEGNLDEGELEIGQVAATIRTIKPAAEILKQLWNEYLEVKTSLRA